MTRVESFERRHWSKQSRIEAGKRPSEEQVRDFREIYLQYAAEESVMLEAQRCLECKEPSCETACPLGNRIRDWLRLASEGKFLEAAAVSRETSNMPEVCGRVCPQDRLCGEGVEFHWLTAPVTFIGDEDGKVRAIECVQMVLGEPDKDGRRKPVEVKGSNYLIEADLVIMAFGFDASPVEGEDASKLTTNKWGNYEVDRVKMTSWPGVFAGGDIVRGADLVVTAIKDGREAAKGIDEYLRHLSKQGHAGADVLAAERGQM
jgi:NADPH-dependent glutamate synthase beta subunit-like oxidoreductase